MFNFETINKDELFKSINISNICDLYSLIYNPNLEEFFSYEKDKYTRFEFKKMYHRCENKSFRQRRKLLTICNISFGKFKKILKDNRKYINYKDWIGDSFEHYLIMYCSIKQIDWCLKRFKLNFNKKNRLGLTPLHCAFCFKVSIDKIKLLLEQNIDVNVKDKFGKVSAHYLVYHIYSKRSVPRFDLNYNYSKKMEEEYYENIFNIFELSLKNGFDYYTKDDNQEMPIASIKEYERLLFKNLVLFFKYEILEIKRSININIIDDVFNIILNYIL